jgi:SpoVK/Ycf46/Vps4 family AAA+-type ATPase
MDEADEFLNSHFSFFSIFFGMGKKESVRKNWLNDFLESHNYKIIWITNHTFLMDESVKRRFDYSIQFSTFNGETREYITSQIIKKYNLENLIQTEDLKEYFLDPSIPVGIIDNVLNQLQQIVKVQKNISKEELLQIAKELFNSNYELVYNHKFKVLNSNDQFYQIDLIHSAPHYQEVLKQIESFIHNNKNKEKNFNCLFYGLAGTGKTEFAKFIAKKFNYRVIEIQPSDIKHFFFGMSERIIKDYFKKASNGNCILIVNEIDVFLSKDPQHEAMNSIQMQFIQEMENFKGILIGTTNSIDKISARAKRRFHLKVEFLPLKKEKLQEVFLLFFSNHLPNPELTEGQKKKLMELEDICLGDFYSVKRQIEYQGELYFEEIYKKLQEEIFYRLHDKN